MPDPVIYTSTDLGKKPSMSAAPNSPHQYRIQCDPCGVWEFSETTPRECWSCGELRGRLWSADDQTLL